MVSRCILQCACLTHGGNTSNTRQTEGAVVPGWIALDQWGEPFWAHMPKLGGGRENSEWCAVAAELEVAAAEPEVVPEGEIPAWRYPTPDPLPAPAALDLPVEALALRLQPPS